MGSHVCISNDAELLEAVIRYPSSGPDQFYDTTYDLFFSSMLHMGCPEFFHLDWCILSCLRITIGAFFALDIIAYMSLYSVSMLDAYITHLTYCVT